MSQLEALIGVLEKNNGDELILDLGVAPSFLKKGVAIRLFLRPLSEARHEEVLLELLTEEQRELLATSRSTRRQHTSRAGLAYDVVITGERGHRVRVVREEAEKKLEEAPVIKVSDVREPTEAVEPVVGPELSNLLRLAVERGASDLHLATGEPATLRINGRLSLVGLPVEMQSLLHGFLTAAEIKNLQNQSLDRALTTSFGQRFRANIYRHHEGLAAAFRVLRPTPPPLSRLGLPVDLAWLTKLSHGLVLFCGPTGSGKTTTLASLVQHRLKQQGGLLITLEEPIEYVFESGPGSLVRQRQVPRDVPDYVTGLTDALREDPDVLLIGEMRDAASIQLALTAAETGHLVFSTLHSRSAAGAIERVIDTYPPERQRQIRVQLAESLQAVVSQRLLPDATGTSRVPCLEVLRVNQAAAHLIREGKTPSLVSVMQTGSSQGMITMERCAQRLVQLGRVHPEHTKNL